MTKNERTTKVFAIAGLDGRTIGNKSLIGFSSGLTLIIKQQMLSSTINKNQLQYRRDGMLISCHRKYRAVSGYNRMTRIFTTILLIFTLTSCNQNLTIKDVVITERLFSPDSSYVALTYYVDNGAMGESSSMTSVLKVTDTTEILNKSMLPCLDLPFNSCYFPDHWVDNKTLQLFLHEIPFVKAGLPFDSTSIKVNGINCKVVPYDYSKGLTPLIEYVSFSDDRKKLLVAYRYRGDLNISVINYGDKLPKFGNIFTNTEIEFNPIVYAKWNGGEIDMFMKDAKMFETSNYINKKIPYKVRFVDIRQLEDTFPLYKDILIDNLLRTSGVTIKATITESQWRKDTDKSLFYYEYEYEVAGQKFRSYFRIFKEFKNGADYQNGDTITIKYDPKQPLIHATAKNYSR